ncbi:hypothetical protein GOBAR_AA11067 [Gossypium barbadense]|uniref:Cation-transporting P-type ATPase C-terminal domain-containing protein n=1 Tax=Gossypium barbadense TaxID=3634 RepID=A0A2P5Y1X1_GOSBA|nr:hypothetical protein GOBAR_AA11067 [Gossypium barbadense]
MGVCGYNPFARSFKAFSAETIHLALNLGVDVKVITSDELASGKETGYRLSGSHEHKYEMVMRLQQMTYICGMTGDGVNDAPRATSVASTTAISNNEKLYMLSPLLSKLSWDLCFLLLFGNLISRISWI